MGGPGGGIGEMPRRVLPQGGDHRPGEVAAPQIGEGLVVQDIILVAGPQQTEEIGPVLRRGRGEEGEGVIADLGADAVAALVTGAGVVHGNPAGMRQAGPQHIPRLGDESLVGLGQDAHHLPLGDIQADGLEQFHQARYGGLALVVLDQDEALDLGAEVVADPVRQRRHDGLAVRRHPALPPVAHDPWLDPQILHGEVLVALEPRSRRQARDGNHPLFDRHRRCLRPAPSLLAPLLARSLVRHRLHARRRRWRLDVRLTLQALQAGDFLA